MTLSRVPRTSALTLFWKNEAKKPDFWDPNHHGHASRTKPLFKDETMGVLLNALTEDDPTLIDYVTKTLDPKLALAIAVRHKFFTKAISMSSNNTSSPTTQVVLLGSGFDTRPVRKKKYTVRYFEIDKPEVLSAKKTIYRNNNIDPNASYIAIDYLAEDFINHLKQAGIDFAQPTHFIWEGNTFYLTTQQIEDVLMKIKQAFTGQVLISFDYMDKKLDAVAEVAQLKATLKQHEAPMQSTMQALHSSICHKLGFQVATHHACSDLTQAYQVGDQPYASQKSYYLCTLSVSATPKA